MHMQSNNDEKKYRFFDPFTGEAPLKGFSWKLLYTYTLRQKWGSVRILNTSEWDKNVTKINHVQYVKNIEYA